MPKGKLEIKKIDTNKKCDYGCGNSANYQFKNGKVCCSEHFNKCPGKNSKEVRKKISNTLEEYNKTGKVEKNYCVDCGVKITKNATRCNECSNKGENNPFFGKTFSEESLKSIKKSLSEYYKNHDVHLSEEAKKKIGDAHRGKIVSEESREKMSKSKLGKKNPRYGETLSEEAKKKIGEGNKGKTVSEESREKMSKAKSGENNPLYNKSRPEEVKRKISEGNKGKHKGKTHSKEVREKMRKSTLEYMKENNDSFSKISQECFWKIYKELPKDLQEQTYFAELNHEHFMCGKYMVDFYIKPLNLIIEFFGDYWHANPKEYKKDDVIHVNKASQIWKEDKQRIKNLEKHYKVFIIWESDYNKNSKKVIESKLKDIEERL